MSFVVRYSTWARDDPKRLHELLLGRATYVEDLDLAERVLGCDRSIARQSRPLPIHPPQARPQPFRSLLPIPSGNSGYVAPFEIDDASTVTTLALRHQLEDDYH